jgi:hypothetical protein
MPAVATLRERALAAKSGFFIPERRPRPARAIPKAT